MVEGEGKTIHIENSIVYCVFYYVDHRHTVSQLAVYTTIVCPQYTSRNMGRGRDDSYRE